MSIRYSSSYRLTPRCKALKIPKILPNSPLKGLKNVPNYLELSEKLHIFAGDIVLLNLKILAYETQISKKM